MATVSYERNQQALMEGTKRITPEDVQGGMERMSNVDSTAYNKCKVKKEMKHTFSVL